MPFSRFIPALVVTAFVVVLIAAGVLLWSSAWSKENAFEKGVRNCVTEMARHDPSRDARTALARGDDRFYFWWHNGFAMSFTADGVPGAACDGVEAGARQWPFDTQFADLGPRCCDIDPQLTACGEAQRVYRQAYNAQLARLNPRSVSRYCEPKGRAS